MTDATAAVHHGARERGCDVAAQSARAAGRPDAAHWRALSTAADDPGSQVRLAAFLQGLQELGWTVGRNVQVDFRGSTDDASRMRYATELVALGPDVILAQSGVVVGALQWATRTVPIVFAGAIDPVGAGLVASLARPGGNATGFASYEFSLAAKWLELLKDIAPRVVRVAILRDPAVPAGSAPFGAIQGAASSLRVEGSRLTPATTASLSAPSPPSHKSRMVD
jgi:putative ABC transport system substrate-binding protein